MHKRYPEMQTALDSEDAWQLLVATVMSAQTTDENVNKVAPVLFDRYPTPEDLAAANPEDVEKIIYSTGYYRQKTKSRTLGQLRKKDVNHNPSNLSRARSKSVTRTKRGGHVRAFSVTTTLSIVYVKIEPRKPTSHSLLD